jgi:hypothetical protein
MQAQLSSRRVCCSEEQQGKYRNLAGLSPEQSIRQLRDIPRLPDYFRAGSALISCSASLLI